MATTREHLERRALLATRSLVDRMRALYRELERLTGAPIAVHRALACIGDEPGITASRLALSLGMQRPAVSHVLRGLVERGWVERVRNDSDQRSVQIYLTAAGRTLRGATAGRAVGALQRSVRRLPYDKLEALAAGVDELLRHLPPPTAEGMRFPAGTPHSTSRATPAAKSVASRRSSGKVQR
jgi:DNA-binding MarR family transcriptional regulator